MKRLLLLVVGCAQPPTAEFTSPQIIMPRGRDFVIARHVDMPRPEPQASGANVLYLNFDGVSLTYNTDDAPSNTSELTQGATVNVPPFALPSGAKFTLQQGKDAVTDRLRWFYKPYDLQIVTSRPSNGNYTMVAVGGKNTLIPGLTGAAGVSPLDCDSSNPNNVVYDFSDEQPPDYGGLPGIAITAAHESGHSYGLEHTDNPNDIMYSVASPNIMIGNIFGASFTTTGNYSSFNGGGEITGCPGRGTTRNNQALLTTALNANPSPGDTTLPTVALTFPTNPYVPTQFPVRADASDNNRVVRVEVYKNLELIAVLTSPPYQATVTAADNEAFFLTVEAIDPDANRKTVTKEFQALASTPQLCPNGQGDCKTNQTCKDGICRYPEGTPCTVVDAASGFSPQCEFSCKQPVGVSQTICTNTCNSSRPCETGNICGADSLCAPGTTPPMPKMVGDACTDGSECASMLCEGTCLATCDSATPCGDGMMCAQVTGGMGCVPAMPKPASSGCSIVPAPTGIPWFLLAFLLFWVRRRATV